MKVQQSTELVRVTIFEVAVVASGILECRRARETRHAYEWQA